MVSEKSIRNSMMDVVQSVISSDLDGAMAQMRGMLAQAGDMVSGDALALAKFSGIHAELDALIAKHTSIQTAQAAGDQTAVDEILAAMQPEHDYYEGYPEAAKALHEAINEGDLAEIRKLLPLVPLNEGYGEYGMPPIYWAMHAQSHRLEIVQMLLDAGAAADFATNEGSTPLHWIADSSYCEDQVQHQIAALLVARGGQIAAENQSYGWTPLHAAVMQGSPDEVAALLAQGASPNQPYAGHSMPEFSRGCLPLMIAATKAETLALLLAHGADPFATAKDGISVVEHLRLEAQRHEAELAAAVAAGEDREWDHRYTQGLRHGYETVLAWSKHSRQ